MKTFHSTRRSLAWCAPSPLLLGVLALFTVACTVAPLSMPDSAPGSTPISIGDKSSEIDELFSWATLETPGCAVAVSQNGEVVVNRAYGLANLESELPITPETRFDIGSVQKQFVAAAILLLVEDGLLTLTDDIGDYFPELPDYGHTITIDHLMTHTSGVRDWVMLLQMSNESADALTLILRQKGLNFVPGNEWSYSNSNFVLLKELIPRTTGMHFSEFARERLFEPLGMERSIYAQDVHDVEDRALAYQQEGDSWELNILVGDERGDGGALFSTANDLLIWNEALTNARLGAFVTEKLQEPARLNNGRELSYARGLFLDEDPVSTIVWHSGSAAAYKSMLARLPEVGLSFAFLCNAGESAEGQFADPIIDLFVPDRQEAEAEAGGPSASVGTPTPDPSGREGLFFNERTGDPLRLVLQGGRLRVDDGPELVAVAHDRYRNEERSLTFMSDDEVELHFLSADELTLTTREGEINRYHRSQPASSSATDLEAFVGRYASEELQAVIDIALADDTVTASLSDSPPYELTPVDPDTFQLGRLLLRFVRDEDGKVIALDYSNPVLRKVRFTR